MHLLDGAARRIGPMVLCASSRVRNSLAGIGYKVLFPESKQRLITYKTLGMHITNPRIAQILLHQHLPSQHSLICTDMSLAIFLFPIYKSRVAS